MAYECPRKPRNGISGFLRSTYRTYNYGSQDRPQRGRGPCRNLRAKSDAKEPVEYQYLIQLSFAHHQKPPALGAGINKEHGVEPTPLIVSDSLLYLLTGCSINSRGEITGLGLTSTGEIHTYLAIPTHDGATSESSSQGVISPRILRDDARKLLQQQLRFGRSGARSMGLQ